MEKLYYYKNNPIVKNIFLKMLVPTIFMNLTTAIASFADTVIIGFFLNELALSVVTFATPIYMIINTFAALYSVGGSIAMSIDSGKGDKQNSNKVFSISIELLIFTGIILVLAGLLFGKQITVLLGAGAEVFDMVYNYSMIVLLAAPVFMLNIGLAFFVRNDGRPTLSMIGMFLSIAVNIVFDIIFIGFLNLGVAGAAYATVLGQLVSCIVISSHFLSRKNTLRFKFNINTMMFRVIKNGASTALHFVYQFLSILVLNHFVMSLAGTSGIVIYTVVFNLYTVSLALFEGLSQTIQPMVSLYYGENSNKKIKNTLKLALWATLIICGGFTVILEMFPKVVPVIFGVTELELLQQSIFAVRIYGTSMIIMTINVIIGYYLQSTENNFMSAVLVSLRCFFMFLGSAFILGKLFGMNGVWASYTMAEVITFLVFIIMNRFKRLKLLKQGINVDPFLLDREIEKNTYCFIFNCQKDDFEELKKEVLAKAQKSLKTNNLLNFNLEQYLAQIQNCITKRKNQFIEIEINQKFQKVIIRDNLDHKKLNKNILNSISQSSKIEYSPVLGWNRICLE